MARSTAVGLDIGTSCVRAAELSFGSGRVTLARAGEVALPPGAVRAGEVAAPEAVTAALRELWSQHRFSSKKVMLGLANSRVVVRQVDLPWMPVAELRASLALHVQDFVPMPVASALLDFHPLEEIDTGTARLWRGLLVAASRETVEAQLDAVRAAGLTPVGVDLAPFASLRSLGWEEPALDAVAPVQAIVDIGAGVTSMVVHQAGAPKFVRILLIGGNHVSEALAGLLGVPFDAAEQLKQDLRNFDGDERALQVASSSMGMFVDEIRGSLDYYRSAHAAAPVTQIVLTGGGSRLGGLAVALGAATRVPVVLGDPTVGIALGKAVRTESFDPRSAAVPVGLALGAAS
ncbi:type IV pilus assembly protein PilM [Motilibacter peucedani]|uniref:Type IV pilus assembly protein PilM n=1 Tax=Motilibacter peucedani TaxID=598650 RepID=A0A420XSH5_9ACTN|nr:type IV pilus assembly protein PilM [Motilibacter peucedani]RKS77759.1 type IV pilus assembly protein PilM [Motilibacter peucedani]